MTEQIALQILVEAINLAMTKGCYGVVENTNITNAITKLDELVNKPPDNKP